MSFLQWIDPSCGVPIIDLPVGGDTPRILNTCGTLFGKMIVGPIIIIVIFVVAIAIFHRSTDTRADDADKKDNDSTKTPVFTLNWWLFVIGMIAIACVVIATAWIGIPYISRYAYNQQWQTNIATRENMQKSGLSPTDALRMINDRQIASARTQALENIASSTSTRW